LNRTDLLAVLALTFLLVGLITFHPGPLAVTVLLVVRLAAGLIFGPSELDLQVTRSISSSRPAPWEEVRITLTVKNLGGRLEEIYLQDALPEAIELIDGHNQALLELRTGQTLQMDYRIRGRRGIHLFEGLLIETNDKLGLQSKRTARLEPARLIILPQPLFLKKAAVRPQHTRLSQGVIPARAGGAGTDFYSVRSYEAGDSLRRINWKASSRQDGALFTNDFQQERAADIGLILDARQRSDIGGAGIFPPLFEYKIEAAASLSEALLRHGNRVGLLVYGGFLDWTLPAYGKIQQERLLQALAGAKTGHSLIFDRLENLPTRLFPPQSQIILISSLNPEDLPFLIRIRAVGYALVIVSPNPVLYEKRSLKRMSSETTLGLRLASIERSLLLNRLRQAGILVLDWDTSIQFDQASLVSFSRAATLPQPFLRAPRRL
jgi:uncharacterized protein (DUF58 family)